METCLNNYVLRIYRLDRKDPRQLVGLVEEVGGKGKRPFTNLHELWEILSHPKRTSVGPGRKKGREIDSSPGFHDRRGGKNGSDQNIRA